MLFLLGPSTRAEYSVDRCALPVLTGRTLGPCSLVHFSSPVNTTRQQGYVVRTGHNNRHFPSVAPLLHRGLFPSSFLFRKLQLLLSVYQILAWQSLGWSSFSSSRPGDSSTVSSWTQIFPRPILKFPRYSGLLMSFWNSLTSPDIPGCQEKLEQCTRSHDVHNILKIIMFKFYSLSFYNIVDITTTILSSTVDDIWLIDHIPPFWDFDK